MKIHINFASLLKKSVKWGRKFFRKKNNNKQIEPNKMGKKMFKHVFYHCSFLNFWGVSKNNSFLFTLNQKELKLFTIYSLLSLHLLFTTIFLLLCFCLNRRK